MKTPVRYSSLVLCLLAIAAAGRTANADQPDSRARQHVPAADHRRDDRNYPPRGHLVYQLPRDAYVSKWRGSPYYFHSGVWYRPSQSHWIVVAPPPGLIVPFLPPFYTTLWITGVPYYYANDVYYAWRPEQRSYVVVEPPDAEQSAGAPVSARDIYVYPKNGQSAEQQATDRYECHRWAADQTGFDPTKPSGGVAPGQVADKHPAYLRAMTACLEGRGYSVK